MNTTTHLGFGEYFGETTLTEKDAPQGETKSQSLHHLRALLEFFPDDPSGISWEGRTGTHWSGAAARQRIHDEINRIEAAP